ncbi:MAG: PHP domain-containing protein [Bacteroidales bacterium]|nr:PHP domain-containing protein [Bacteroidales bacterium]
MSDYLLKDLPDKVELLKWHEQQGKSDTREVNAHLHTPYSFSAFQSVPEIFKLAEEEGIDVLGINDFYVSDGYLPFYNQSKISKIFPLFNIEFIGLLPREQVKDIRVNDPNNPGRTYFCGKGLDYPFELESPYDCMLRNLKYESQIQVKEMVERVSAVLESESKDLALKYSEVKRVFAKDLVRERHIARAIRSKVFEKYQSAEDRRTFLSKIFDGKEVKSDLSDEAALENEIRSNLLKAGGKAFVPEDKRAFLPIPEIIEIILNAGGIPCYPVLLDDENGNCTEYETDKQILLNELISNNVYCIELIPGRNDIELLREFVSFFKENKFIVTFGTEHNTPVMTPLKITARNGAELDEELKKISYDGACVIAAHQYLHAKGKEGYVNLDGIAKQDQIEEYIKIGKAVIDKFIQA